MRRRSHPSRRSSNIGTLPRKASPMRSTATAHFVSWFRSVAPYIHAHNGKTFVVACAGEVLAGGLFTGLTHDLALLNSLGIRVVLVHGARPQINSQLEARGAKGRFVNGLRITSE